MWVLFLLIPVITALTDLPIGLIVDTRMPQAKAIVDAAIEKMKSPDNLYNYIVKNDASGTCSKGPNFLKTGYLMGNFYKQDKIKAVFGPMCYGDQNTASRLAHQWDIPYFSTGHDHPYDYLRKTLVQMTTRSSSNTAENIYAFMKGADWRKLAVFYCRDCYPSEEEVAIKQRMVDTTGYLRKNGILITFERSVFKNSTIEFYQQQLQGIEKLARVILPFLGATIESYANLQLAMKAENMSTSEYSTIIVLPDYQIDGISFPWKQDDPISAAFQNSVVLYNNMNLDLVSTKAATEILNNAGSTKEMQQTYIEIYESMIVFNALMTMSPWTENQPFSGRTLLQGLNGDIEGPFGPNIVFNSRYRRVSPFLAYLIKNGTLVELERLTYSFGSDKKASCFKNEDPCLQFVTNMELNTDQPTCGFYEELCDQTGTIIIIAAVTTTVFAGVGFYIGMRRIKATHGGSPQSAMPWVIPFNSVEIFDRTRYPQDTSMNSLRNHIADTSTQQQPAHVEKPIGICNMQYCYVDRYIQREKVSFSKNDIQMLFQLKQLNHDNVNTFLGMSFDRSTHLYILWNQGFRGTLRSWIHGKKDKRIQFVEKNFKEAFVRDILKGLEHIHSNIGYHGALTPEQCIIDTHWIIKISGYSVSRLLFRWKAANTIATPDGKPLIPNEELHYYAPEVRRKLKSLLYTNRIELLKMTTKEGQAADMWAFGTILYEIIHGKKMVEIDEYIGSEQEDDGFIMCEKADALLPCTTPTEESMDKDVHNDLKGLMVSCWNPDIEERSPIQMARKIAEATMRFSGSLVDQMIQNMQMYTKGLESLVTERTAQLEKAQKKADDLLSDMLPPTIAADLKKGNPVEARHYKSVTIMYSDIVGFTSLCSESLPMEVVQLLGPLFFNFDSIIKEHDGYKLETIGDAYCVASGIPVENKLKHVANIANIALKQRKFMTEFEIPHRPGNYLHCRWGFNTGPLFSGVIGRRAPRYACFGQTVVIAAKMENSGIPDKIQMTFESYKLLKKHFPEFICSSREGGAIKISGIGHLLTFWLDGVEELLRTDRAAFDKALEEHESRKESKSENPYLFQRATSTSASSISNVTPQLTAETSL